MDPRRRRVVAARERDRDWQAEVDALRDLNSLYYELSLIDEGWGACRTSFPPPWVCPTGMGLAPRAIVVPDVGAEEPEGA